MLLVTVPSVCKQELSYITRVLFADFLGIEYKLFFSNSDAIVFRANGKSLKLSSTFFSLADQYWLQEQSLPIQPLSCLDVEQLGFPVNTINNNIPVIYGDKSCKKNHKSIYLGLDILGSAFFMLSRYEEAVKSARDQHDRFPATASLALQENFLNRPIVNEYLEILWACMRYLWPNLKKKHR